MSPRGYGGADAGFTALRDRITQILTAQSYLTLGRRSLW